MVTRQRLRAHCRGRCIKALATLTLVAASFGALAQAPASASSSSSSSAAAPASAGAGNEGRSGQSGEQPVHEEKRSESGNADHQDESAPLRSMAPAPFVAKGTHADVPLPQPAPAGPDPVVQSSPAAAAAPATSSNFEGVGNGFAGPSGTYAVNSAPPDTNGAAGPNHYFQIVNTAFAIFNKTGTPVYGPVNNNTLWSGFGGSCQTTNDGDAVVRYDQIADRWFVTQFANVRSVTGPFYECVAVSSSSDPLGSYYRYSFSYANFPDYPKVGVWPDAYYITFNMFNPAGTVFLGAKSCAYDRTAMLAGTTASQQCFDTSATYGGLLPADLDGSTPPPAAAPNTQVALGASSTQLATWKFHVDWATPSNSTFTGPTALSVAAYNIACAGGTCIPQGGTSDQLDALSDRLMFRLAYRNFGDHESLVVNHSVTASGVNGVRWYELRLSAGTVSVFQQGTYAPDASSRWMGSIAMDKAGNIALGYSQSSSSTKPSIRYTGRLAGDPPGTMTQGEGTVITGAGAQTDGLSRWGDYSAMTLDPLDGCTFWYTNEYIPADGSFNWRTRIASFVLPGCATPPANDFSIAVSPTSASVAQGSSTTPTVSTTLVRGSAQTVTLSVTGLPTGATASFSPPSVTSGNSSTMTIATTSGTPAGTYPISVNGTGTSVSHFTTFTLTVLPPPDIVNGGFETGTLSGWSTGGAASSVTTSTPHTGTYAALVGSTTTAVNADSTISQTFAPPGPGTLSLWYKNTCPDTVEFDWTMVTLTDNTASTTSTLLPKTCVTNGAWTQITTSITSAMAGHSLTLTLLNHDDSNPSDISYTKFDDVLFTPTVPAAPTGLTATTVSMSQIDLSWNASAGASSYKVERSTDGSTGWIQIGTPTAASFSDTGLTPGNQWFYRVRATNAAGDSAYSVVKAATTALSRLEQSAGSYSADWWTWYNAGQSGGTAAVTSTAGGKATFTFNGTAVRWIGQRGLDRAVGAVSIDGGPVTTVDTYASAYADQQALFMASGLAPATHTLTITWNSKNTNAAATSYLVIDAFEIA